MNKNWKEYSPREDAWGKIMQRKDFNSQLDKNLKELPSHSPSDLVWTRIEQKLENKKRAFVWKPFVIAASLTGLFLLAFYLIRQGTVVIEAPQQTNELMASNPPDVLKEEENLISPSEEIISDSDDLTVKAEEDLRIERVSEFIPEMKTERNLNLENSIALKGMNLEKRGEFIPPTENSEETYHRVAISWGLRVKKIEVVFPFGQKSLQNSSQIQASRSSSTKKIQLGKRNQ